MSSVAVVTGGQSTRASTTADGSTIGLRDPNGGMANNIETITELILSGAVQLKWVAVSTGYAMASPGSSGGGDCIVYADATGGSFNVTLPSPIAVGAGNFVMVIKKNSANTVTILPNGAETINGAASKALTTQYTVCRLWSDGTNWVSSTTTS